MGQRGSFDLVLIQRLRVIVDARQLRRERNLARPVRGAGGSPGYGRGSARRANDEVDDGFQLNIEFASGQRAYIEVGTYNFIPMPRFYMRARQGSAIITDWRVPAHIVKCKAWHESDVIPVVNGSGLTKTMAPRDSITTDEYDIERPVTDVHDYYRNFVRAIDGKEEQMVTHEQMRCVLRVIMSAFESVEKGGAVIEW